MRSSGFKLAAAVSALVLGLAFGVWAEEGVTDTEIHIGQWGPQTGPAAAWGSVARGTDAYFKMINAEGGIHGRKLIHHMFDDAYNPAKTLAGVKELQEGTGMFAWVSGVGTAPGLAVKDYLMERKIPWVGPSAGSLHWIEPPQKYLFAVYPLYYIEAKALVRYGVEKMGFKKVAIIYQNDDYGKNGVKGAKEELAEHNMKLVAEVPVNLTDSDLKPHVMKLKNSGADMVLLWTSPKHAVITVGTSKAMQFAPQFMSTSTCSDFPLMMHISKGLWEGVIAATFAELPDSPHPLMQKYKKDAFEQFAAKDERWGLFFYAGIVFSEPLVEGIKRCGKDLTRERLVKELEGLKDFQGISGKIGYKPFDPNDPSCRQGQNQTFLVKCLAGGKAEKLTDWMTIE
ncbi:MAG: ABC transporter substrate-binding protein [Deltaproteobacteria bacterium]|nr:ABC transporter substrate-binding protein [Deltaproteobacteria bacterium]